MQNAYRLGTSRALQPHASNSRSKKAGFVRWSLCHCVPYVLPGLLVLAGCEQAESSTPSPASGAMDAGNPPSPMAGMGGSSGSGGTAAPPVPPGTPPYSTGGFGGSDCATPHAAGIASGVLGDEPSRLTETFDFQQHPAPQKAAWQLRSRPGGLLALGVSFFDIELGVAADWHEVGANTVADVISADFDGDGDEDLITLATFIEDSSPLDALTVWERTDDGLTARGDLPVTRFQHSNRYASGDVDGDGDLDLATFERGLTLVMRNDGDFVFSRVESSPADDDYELFWTTRAAVLEDRDADGKADLWVLAGRGDAAHALTLLGDGSGQFAAPIVEPITGRAWDRNDIHQAVAGDVTSDGLTDFVVTHADTIVLIDGAEATKVRNHGSYLQLLDFDGDGALDIAALMQTDLEVHLSRGGGAFETRALNVGSFDMVDFEISRATEHRPMELHALYEISCYDYEPCDAGCARCMFGACVECMTHADCTTGLCERHECTSGEPAVVPEPDDDGGVP